ncbi:hypothetical protein [Alteribacter natronophilus]|uniref:hypothetical protein n=1 Tax=Alteribacter natronophilus TaxID=2583810 RepID=UPI00110DEE2C|nr:hypothetical protein [Alteribacter natronophilus]TMW71719.1 hypothetical protein FGB90_11875 [Alteribacter natronophilus]
MKMLITIAALLVSICWTPSVFAGGDELLQYSEITITAVSDGVEYEWEYINPDRFEVERGEAIIKGSEAEKEITQLVSAMALSENPSAESLAQVVKSAGLSDLSSLTVKALDRDRCLFTWGWRNEDS